MISMESQMPTDFKVKHVVKIARNILVLQCTRRTNKVLKTSRNMVIVRRQEELTLVNAVRLNTEGEELLQRLGYVARVVRLGTRIGAQDDLYYKEHHGSQIWAPGLSSKYQVPVDQFFDGDSLLPIPYSKVFMFHNLVEPEVAILIQPAEQSSPGLLVLSEALQNQKDNHLLSISSRTIMSLSGMMESNVVVPPKWIKSQLHKLHLRDDFDRLLRLEFSSLIPAKGALVLQQAKEESVVAVEMAFPIW